MSDAELYMTIQNSGYRLSVRSPFDENFQQTGVCDGDAYMTYVERLYRNKYSIKGDPVNMNVGLYPWDMEDGFHYFLSANGNPNTHVKWARYSLEPNLDQKWKVIDDIESMLNKDIPVVFSYHTFDDDEIMLYNSEQAAINNTTKNEDGNDAKSIPSHYMTIVGLYKFATNQPLHYNYILKVVSWGQVYYINYDMYANKLSWFSNILSVY